MSWIDFIKKHFSLFYLLGILVGYIFSGPLRFLEHAIIPLLAVVMTLSFLSIDIGSLKAAAASVHIYLLIIGVFKVLLPGLLYFAVLPFSPEIALALLLLTATSMAIISTVLTDLLSGDTAFILMLVVFSTLIAPFQMPLVLRLFAGRDIEIDALSMMITLIKLILVPFGISMIIRFLLPNLVKKTKYSYSAVSVLLSTAVLMAVLTNGADYIRSDLGRVPLMLGPVFAFGGLNAMLGYHGLFLLSKKRRIGLSVSTLYMNIGLSVIIAVKYFSPAVLMFCVLYELPANTIPGLIKRFRNRRTISKS